MSDKNALLEQFIKDLNQTDFLDDKAMAEFLRRVHELYDDGWRHSYSIVTQVFIQNIEIGKLKETLIAASDKLKQVFLAVEREGFGSVDSDTPETAQLKERQYDRRHRSLEKLCDHLNLEATRMNYNERVQRSAEAKVQEIHQEALDVSQKLEQLKESLEQATNKQQTHSVTILGIFTGIVMAFVSMLVMSSSMLSNIDKISMPRLMFVAILLLLFNVNSLFFLFNFVLKVKDNTKLMPWRWITGFNVICLIVLVSLIFA